MLTNVVTRAETAENPPDLSWAGYPYGGSYSQTADADGDGLSDYDEIFLTNTDPWLADSDGDWILDGEEVVLLHTMWRGGAGSGCFVSHFLREIQQAMDALASGCSLTFADVSRFVKLPEGRR